MLLSNPIDVTKERKNRESGGIVQEKQEVGERHALCLYNWRQKNTLNLPFVPKAIGSI